MENVKVFKTKSGFCHIISDKIILTKNGIIGDVSNIAANNGSLYKILIIYAVISVYFIYLAYDNYLKGNIDLLILCGLIAASLIYGVLTSLNNSAAPVIERHNIKKVVFKKGFIGLSRPRFEVLFENETGKIKKRLILLPSFFNGGEIETEKALKIMRDEKLV